MYSALSVIKKGSTRLQSESVVSEKLGNGTFSYQVKKITCAVQEYSALNQINN